MRSLRGARLLKAAVAGLALILAIGAEVGHETGALEGLERPWSDLWVRMSGLRDPIEHVALVELDEQTLAAYPDDPLVFWSPQFARASEVLLAVGVPVVGLDFLFNVSPEKWLAKVAGSSSPSARSHDQRFRQMLATGKLVIVGQQSDADPLLPAPDYLAALPDFNARGFVGAADLVFDEDGTLRHAQAVAPGAAVAPADGLKLLGFPFLLALHASGQSPDAPRWRVGGRSIDEGTSPWQIPYSGPPGSVPRISMRHLLAKGAVSDPQVQALKGKVVIVGPSIGGTNDAHFTPYGRGFIDPRLMPGMESHAQVVEALLDGRFQADATPGQRLGVLGAALALGAWLWTRFSIRRGALLLAGLLAFLMAAACGFAQFDLGLPVFKMQLAVVLLFLSTYALRLSRGEKDVIRVREIFSRYVSSDVVETLLASGDMPSLGGRTVDITVLFSDIRNFTTISERLSAEEVVEFLNQWFERACLAVQEEGGCIDKFIGDAIMVEFGAPVAYPDHCRRGLRAAVKLAAQARAFQDWMQGRFTDRDLPAFEIGVGLHCGPAVVGNVGSRQRLEYTAIGDTVNLASRLESASKGLHCVIVASQDVVTRAGAGVQSGRSDTIAVKGREETVTVLEILGLED